MAKRNNKEKRKPSGPSGKAGHNNLKRQKEQPGDKHEGDHDHKGEHGDHGGPGGSGGPGDHDKHAGHEKEQGGHHGGHSGGHGDHDKHAGHDKEQGGHHSGHSGGHNGHGSHDKHAGHHTGDFKRRFWISLVITIPILLLSPMIQEWLGFEITFPGDRYILAVLSTFVYFYGGWPFLKGLYDEVRHNAIGMMTLIGVAITAAWGYSFAITLGLEGMDFYWEMATLIVIMLLGHWIEMKSISGASRALELLVKMMPSSAHLVTNGEAKDVSVEELKENDVVLIKPGEKIPVDGEIIDGESHLDESMLTGESRPVKKGKGNKVIAGSVNSSGSLKVRATGIGKDSYLNKVIKMVEDAQKIKSKTQHLADRAAKILTFVALGGGIITLSVWLLLGFEFVYALERMVTVMVISCPHALGLAVPLVVAISTTVSAQKGLLIRNRTAFENSRKISLLAFDKTGTLTMGNFGVTRYGSLSNEMDDKEVLRLAGALEAKSEHPLAVGIMEKIKQEKIDLPEAGKFKAITGKGIEADVENRKIRVVSPGYLEEKQIPVPEDIYKSEAETIVFILADDDLIGFIAMADEIRKESYEAVKTLKEHGLKLYMMTGDNERVARSVSEELGLDGWFAGVLPDQKLEKVKEFQQKGEIVAMTGDGINDAPALAQANIGIAVGSGTDVAAETADIILVNSNPVDIAHLILFGKATYNKMKQNLIWATGYNVVAIPLAAGVLYNYGVILSPAAGAVLMSLSTIIVAINAQLLKTKINTKNPDSGTSS
jgi:P-type Cu2+ transporter